MVVQYKISDLGNYIFSVDNPDQLVSYAASSLIFQIISGMEIDDALTTAKLLIQTEAKKQIQDIPLKDIGEDALTQFSIDPPPM